MIIITIGVSYKKKVTYFHRSMAEKNNILISQA